MMGMCRSLLEPPVPDLYWLAEYDLSFNIVRHRPSSSREGTSQHFLSPPNDSRRPELFPVWGLSG
jgi:hypothetical protein